MAVEQFINKALKQLYFKSRRSVNGSFSGRGSSARSDINSHKCCKKGHIHKECRSKGNGSSGNSPKNSTNELTEWVTQKPVVSDTKYPTIANMTRNNKKYKWCTSCNNGQGWKNEQMASFLAYFSTPRGHPSSEIPTNTNRRSEERQ